MVSEKVGLSLAYQAAWRVGIVCPASNALAASVMIEYSPRIAGTTPAFNRVVQGHEHGPLRHECMEQQVQQASAGG